MNRTDTRFGTRRRRRRKRRSIQSRLMFWSLLVGLLGITVMTFGMGAQDWGFFQAQSTHYLDQLVKLRLEAADRYFSELSQLGQMVCRDQSVQDAVHYRNESYPAPDYRIELLNQRRVADRLNQLNLLNTIDQAMIIGNHQDYYYYYGRSPKRHYFFKDVSWFREAITQKNKTATGLAVFTALHNQDYLIAQPEQQVCSLVLPIFDRKSLGLEPAAWLLLDFKPQAVFQAGRAYSAVEERAASAPADGVRAGGHGFSFALFSKDGPIYLEKNQLSPSQVDRVLAGFGQSTGENRSATLPAEKRGEEPLLVVGKPSVYTGWTLCGIRTMSELDDLRKNLIRGGLLLLLVFSPLILLASWLLARGFSRPLQKLQVSFAAIAEGDVGRRLEKSDVLEIQNLTEVAEHMVRNIIRLRDEAANAQLEALQQQINPHFINNVLQSTKALAVMRDYESISRLNTELGKYLNYAMNNPHEAVRLRDECAYCACYLAIQSIRYPNRFRYSFNLSDALGDLPMPKVFLQPLVENALLHAMRPATDENGRETAPLLIEISARSNGSRVRVEVRDNGLGMTEEKLEALRAKLRAASSATAAAPPSASSHGLALVNTCRRMKAFYGDEAGLELESQPDIGTTARLLLPITPTIRGKKAESGE